MRAVPQGVADGLTRELAGWLEGPAPGRAAVVAGWGPETWSAFRRVVTFHGLAPHLDLVVAGSPVAAAVPLATLDWLTGQATLNARRLSRMHDELAAILAASAADGIEVMPLKGALLTTRQGIEPGRRPMADLDLLVHPGDRLAIGALLVALGYAREPEHAPHPTHDVFVDPGGGRVVSPGEHPDNPRRVEVHVEVKRHLWGWATDDDLTGALWRGARPGEVLGQPAALPRPADLLAHLAIHATSDLLVGRGRLVQWLDLAVVAPEVEDLGDVPHPRLAYPSLRLAQRAQPRTMASDAVDLAPLERPVPGRLVHWAESVPLDRRCGLTAGRPPDAPASLAARWERWRPERWRLDVAYGEVVLPVALARYARTLIGRVRDRA